MLNIYFCIGLNITQNKLWSFSCLYRSVFQILTSFINLLRACCWSFMTGITEKSKEKNTLPETDIIVRLEQYFNPAHMLPG